MTTTNQNTIRYALFLLFLISLKSNAYAKNTCKILFDDSKLPSSSISENLLDEQSAFSKLHSMSEARKANRSILDKINNFVPVFTEGKIQSMSYSEAQRLLTAGADYEVVGLDRNEKYNKPGVEFGYCFGRATFFHLMLLKMGLQKESIFKIWAVGPHPSHDGTFNWSHHVATMVYVRGYGLMVLDTSSPRPTPVDLWMNSHMDRSTDKKLKFYVTEANKFSVKLGKYSRIQLGLSVPNDTRNLEDRNDVYNGYFKDMLLSISQNGLEHFGLSQIAKSDEIKPKKQDEGFAFGLKDFFGY